jgi:GT2 family glycosyltransferase
MNSIERSDMPLDVFVVDNGSNDGSIDYINNLERQNKVIKFIKSKKNLGFGAANNLGINYAYQNGYDYVYLLNQDAWIFDNTISALIELHQQNPGYGILSPFQLERNEKHIDERFRCGVCSYSSNPFVLDDFYFGRKNSIYEVPDVMAAHWLISIDCVKKVGGFSPTFPHYGEDNNYANRAIYHGFKVGICPNVKAVHDRENRKDSREKTFYLNYIVALRMLSNINKILKHGRLTTLRYLLNCSINSRSFVPLKYFVRVMKEYPSIVSNRDASLSIGAFLDK